MGVTLTLIFSAIFSQEVDVLVLIWKVNFLNFPKLTLLLPVVLLQGCFGHLNTNPTFLEDPVVNSYTFLKLFFRPGGVSLFDESDQVKESSEF